MKNKTCGECKIAKPSGRQGWMYCPRMHDTILSEAEQCKTPYITNRDRLNQMSDGVFAFMMTRLILNGCPISGAKTMEDMQACKISTDCTNCLKQLLRQEAKDE